MQQEMTKKKKKFVGTGGTAAVVILNPISASVTLI